MYLKRLKINSIKLLIIFFISWFLFFYKFISLEKIKNNKKFAEKVKVYISKSIIEENVPKEITLISIIKSNPLLRSNNNYKVIVKVVYNYNNNKEEVYLKSLFFLKDKKYKIKNESNKFLYYFHFF